MRSSEKMSTRPRDDARTNSRSQEEKVPMRPEADECVLSRQQELEREVKAWKDQQNKRLQIIESESLQIIESESLQIIACISDSSKAA